MQSEQEIKARHSSGAKRPAACHVGAGHNIDSETKIAEGITARFVSSLTVFGTDRTDMGQAHSKKGNLIQPFICMLCRTACT